MSSSLVPLKTRRAEASMQVKYTEARTFFHWCEKFKTIVCERTDPYGDRSLESSEHHLSLLGDQGPAAPQHPLKCCSSAGVKVPRGQEVAGEVQGRPWNNPRHAASQKEKPTPAARQDITALRRYSR
ncbi:hypothetical protein TNCV_501011 [Trichonephila clavipes]|nr:hypothetical protein TNCV_501011 [Trichonephila clavipes]